MSDGFRWRPLRGERRPPALTTEVEPRDGHHLVSVRGRLTIDTSPDLLEELRRVVKRTQRLKVSLRDVSFIDSSGISVLILGLKLAQENGSSYTLVDPSPKVAAIIELSQLEEFFDIETASGAPWPGAS